MNLELISIQVFLTDRLEVRLNFILLWLDKICTAVICELFCENGILFSFI